MDKTSVTPEVKLPLTANLKPGEYRLTFSFRSPWIDEPHYNPSGDTGFGLLLTVLKYSKDDVTRTFTVTVSLKPINASNTRIPFLRPAQGGYGKAPYDIRHGDGAPIQSVVMRIANIFGVSQLFFTLHAVTQTGS